MTEKRSRAGSKHGQVQDRNTVTCRTETRSRAGPKHGQVQDRNMVTCRTVTKEADHPPLSPSLIDLFRWFSRALGPLFKRPKFSTLIHRVKTFNYCERRVYFNSNLQGSVADPDPHVFGPSGSGSTSQRYGSGSGSGSGSCSGSGSFYHHAKIVRKTLIPTIL
jgi:hypothetical protein